MSIYATPYNSFDDSKGSLLNEEIYNSSEHSGTYYDMDNEISYQNSTPKNEHTLPSSTSSITSSTSKLTNIKVPLGRRYTCAEVIGSM
uniref:Uncharacterized protein n=1 Tax=Parastrongyloides trichosuri TaxID=131310 RepID=A0A0N4Z5W5_PARTI